MLSVLVLFLVQQPARIDPLTQRMQQLCKAKPACVARQKEGVRIFLDTMTRGFVPQAQVKACLDRSTRRNLTDWSKAADCVKRRTAGKR